MSLQSFLTKIWTEIKSLFDGIPSDLKIAIHIGVQITQNIKTFVDSPAADVLTAIIPGDIDDEIKNWLRAKLPEILTELKLADNCSGLTEPAAITACAIKVLQGLDADIQAPFFHSLSVLVAQVAADGKLTWSDGVYLLQWYYQHEYQATT